LSAEEVDFDAQDLLLEVLQRLEFGKILVEAGLLAVLLPKIILFVEQ
jgi:hypothetical protein